MVSSFLAPLLYVLAMGVLLGGFVEADPDELEGATSYLDFVVPGLIAAHAMQTAVGETTFPVMGMIKWQRIYESMLATPLGCRDLVAAHLSFVPFRLATTCGVYRLVLAPFGVYATWWGPIVAFAEPAAGRHGVRGWVYGFSARLTRRRGSGCCSGSASSRCSCSAARSSRSATSATWAPSSPGARRCGTESTSRGCSRSTTSPGGWPPSTSTVLVVLTSAGWFWAVSGLEKRLVS